jgi:hypothetical protein
VSRTGQSEVCPCRDAKQVKIRVAGRRRHLTEHPKHIGVKSLHGVAGITRPGVYLAVDWQVDDPAETSQVAGPYHRQAQCG